MPPRTYLVDAALGLALAAASLVLGFGYFVGGGGHSAKLVREFGSAAAWHRAVLVWWLCAALCVAGLAIRQRWPVLALALTATGVATHLLSQQFKIMPVDLAVLFALYTLASLARPRWLSWAAVVTVAGGLYGSTALDQLAINRAAAAAKGLPALESPGSVLYNTALELFSTELLVVLAFVLGSGVRGRREHLRVLEQRAADLERERDQRAALATAAERARIIRELHDVVAHGLSVMVVQAQGGAAALHRHPDRTAVALRHVVGTGRASLVEMRRLLGVLRRDPAADAELVPQPGIGILPALVDQVRAAGTEVSLRVEGQPEPLPPGVDLSAYRIVQEALTNVLKHAGSGARVSVRLAFAPDQVEIEVTDDGPPLASTVEGGAGLRGIAERVGMFGGRLRAGPVEGGGFRVHAVLPAAPAGALP